MLTQNGVNLVKTSLVGLDARVGQKNTDRHFLKTAFLGLGTPKSK